MALDGGRYCLYVGGRSAALEIFHQVPDASESSAVLGGPRNRRHRPRERIALGARASHVVRATLAPMSRPIVIGFVCGALGGSAVATVLRSGIPTMAGINVFDPLPYVMAVAFFAAVVVKRSTSSR